MLIGNRIKLIRNIRGMTQKELGLKAGFLASSADVRVAQYETGRRTPKEGIINSLALALAVNPATLGKPCFDSDIDVIHALFMLEDIYNLSIRKTDIGDYCIMITPVNATLYENLADWEYIQREYDRGVITRAEYDNWKYSYNISYSKE